MKFIKFYSVCYCYVILCFCRKMVFATTAMVQLHSKFPRLLEQHVPYHLQRRHNAAVPIPHPQPLTRFHFIEMSCSSFILSPIVVASDAIEFETITDERKLKGDTGFVLRTKIGLERIGGTPDDTKGPSPNVLDFLLMKTKEPLYYPTFMFGAWNVTAKLKRVTHIEDSVLISTTTAVSTTTTKSFQRQYFTTIANTIKNQMTINLGIGIPETKVISNRAYNLRSEILLLQNFDNMYPISTDIIDLTWDYRSNTEPTLLLWNDRTNFQLRYEYNTFKHESEMGLDNNVFAATERNRIGVFDMSASRATIETEVTTEYQELSVGLVQALSRIIVTDSRTQKPMIVVDYELSMNRVVQTFTNEYDKSTTKRPCVETPKGIVQCY
jgi:hypothetical protein